MGARFEALIEGVLMAPSDSRYTQVGFNLISVQVCEDFHKDFLRLVLRQSDTRNSHKRSNSVSVKVHVHKREPRLDLFLGLVPAL